MSFHWRCASAAPRIVRVLFPLPPLSRFRFRDSPRLLIGLRARAREDSRGGLDRERPRDAGSSGAASRRPCRGRGLCGVGVGHGPLAGLWLRDASCGVKSQARGVYEIGLWKLVYGLSKKQADGAHETPAVAENHQPEHSQEKQGTQRREHGSKPHTAGSHTIQSLFEHAPTATRTPTQHTTAPLLPSSPQWPPLPRPSPRRPPPPSRRG